MPDDQPDIPAVVVQDVVSVFGSNRHHADQPQIGHDPHYISVTRPHITVMAPSDVNKSTALHTSLSGASGACGSKEVAIICPFEFVDEATGDQICISVSQFYSKITVNQRTYYFCRKTGAFDGAATAYPVKGPIVA